MRSDIYSTARDGALLVRIGNKLENEVYRTIARRYWHYHSPQNGASRYAISLLK